MVYYTKRMEQMRRLDTVMLITLDIMIQDTRLQVMCSVLDQDLFLGAAKDNQRCHYQVPSRSIEH